MNSANATKSQRLQSAAQLHIKELREALEHAQKAPYPFGHLDLFAKLLAKQPDTRALDKALLEAKIEVLNYCSGRMVLCSDSEEARAYKKGFNDKSAQLNRVLADYTAQLAELNKE